MMYPYIHKLVHLSTFIKEAFFSTVGGGWHRDTQLTDLQRTCIHSAPKFAETRGWCSSHRRVTSPSPQFICWHSQALSAKLRQRSETDF